MSLPKHDMKILYNCWDWNGHWKTLDLRKQIIFVNEKKNTLLVEGGLSEYKNDIEKPSKT